MINQLESNTQFEIALGKFIKKFSELEYSLLYYWSLIDDPKNQNLVVKLNFGSSFDDRRKKVTKYINNNLPELSERWKNINNKLTTINKERRYLIHGLGLSNFNNNTIKAVIKLNNQINVKIFTEAQINVLLNEIAHVLTGNDGLEGEFLIDFTTIRFNEYNSLNAIGKIVYRVNDKILTSYKG
ncbi:hypothetical protein U8695_09825 [Aquirufa antheringensis]|jgi:hypothetical protein